MKSPQNVLLIHNVDLLAQARLTSLKTIINSFSKGPNFLECTWLQLPLHLNYLFRDQLQYIHFLIEKAPNGSLSLLLEDEVGVLPSFSAKWGK
jgi:hypothetical protein